jgi:sigma-B regulation protein RsbU (phosphoserine phosphatase)
MPPDPSIIEHVRALQGPGNRNAELIKQVIESWAARRDFEAGHQLLRSLVLKYADAEKSLYRLNRELVDRQRRLDEDLAAAAEIQSSLLPQDTSAFEQLEIAWAFEPSTHIAGDIFNVIRLDASCFAAYALDVSGHGVPAAMVAVSVCQNLQPGSALIRTSDRMSASGHSPRSPAEVLRALDLEYPFERFSNFFTIVYLLIDTAAGTLTCSNAGHPQPVILRNGGAIQRLKRGGPVIGLRSLRPQADRKIVFSEETVRLTPGDRVLLYTDGLTEYQNAAGELYGSTRFLARLEALRERPLADMVEAVRLSLREFGGGANPADDMTLLGIELKEPGATGKEKMEASPRAFDPGL